MQEIAAEPNFDSVKAKALKLLGVQARSRDELARRLLGSGAHSRLVEEVLDRLEEVGLVNDQIYATNLVERGVRKGLALERIRHELLAKGVQAPVIESALSIARSEEAPGSELERARFLAAKKVRSVAKLGKEAAYRRTAGFLFQRGFDPDTVAEATREALADAEVD